MGCILQADMTTYASELEMKYQWKALFAVEAQLMDRFCGSRQMALWSRWR